MIEIPWAVIISFVVLSFAYIIKNFLSNVIENEHEFLTIIGIFLVIYVGAAVAITFLNPQISQNGVYLASTE
jgi:hypothetical protein